MGGKGKTALIFEENFDDESWRDRWVLEGHGDTVIRTEGETSYLETTTGNKGSGMTVVWYKERFPGNCRYEWRAKAEDRHNPIIYFHCHPTETAGVDSIFDLPPEPTTMEKYAGRPWIELYSVGILRSHQDVCNLRMLGGTGTSSAFQEYWKTGQFTIYDAESIFKSYPSPYFGKPDKWFEFALEVRGNRIILEVDGRRVMDVKDPGVSKSGKYTWKPIADGGWFGFQAFVMGGARRFCVDYLRVYRLPPAE